VNGPVRLFARNPWTIAAVAGTSQDGVRSTSLRVAKHIIVSFQIQTSFHGPVVEEKVTKVCGGQPASADAESLLNSGRGH
jgi:hypothetical protein